MLWSTYLSRIAAVGAIAAILGALTCPAAAISERRTSVAQRQSLTVIVYADFALVRDVRRLNVDRGQNRVVFDDVSPQMDPTTAFLTDLSASAPIWVHEHNFETAVLSPEAICAGLRGEHSLAPVGRSLETVTTERSSVVYCYGWWHFPRAYRIILSS